MWNINIHVNVAEGLKCDFMSEFGCLWPYTHCHRAQVRFEEGREEQAEEALLRKMVYFICI